MNIEEKRNFLSDYCCAVESCSKCVLTKTKWEHMVTEGNPKCLSFCDASEEEMDRAIDLIKKSRKDDKFDKEELSTTKIQKHLQIVTNLNKIYEAKNHDYGDSFGKTFQELGIISAITRISDKYNRLVGLATKPDEERRVLDESIEDTLLDMANYCIMTVIELQENNQNNS